MAPVSSLHFGMITLHFGMITGPTTHQPVSDHNRDDTDEPFERSALLRALPESLPELAERPDDLRRGLMAGVRLHRL
jgi:hypothetical protein